MEEYIRRFIQIREEKDISLEEAAEKLDLPAAFLRLIELGEMVPTEKQMEAIMAFVVDQL